MKQLSRREWIAGSTALAAMAATPLRAFAEAPSPLPLHLIHPELRALAPTVDRPPLTRATLAQTRKSTAAYSQKPLGNLPYEKRMIPVGPGHPEVAIFIVNSKPGAYRPAILHTHGGGFVNGSAESSVRGLQEICARLDCVAISVDYRLAPETTYRGSIEDNYAGLKWLHANAAEVGADPAKIAVLGESAGGGHAALLAIAARDRGEVPVCFQCLIYPMLDDRTGTTRMPPPNVGTLIWNPQRNRFGWESFLGMAPGGRHVPAAGVPARTSSLGSLPPTFIGVGTLDLFANEDIDYAQRLTAAGVSAELIVVPGAFHGFDTIAKTAGTPLGTWFEQTKLNALRRGFGMAAI